MTQPDLMQSDGIAELAPEVAEMAEAWPLIDALTGGTLAMRKAGKAWLPQFPKESAASYRTRLETAVLFPAFARTTEVLAFKPFARPIKVEKVPPGVESTFGNIDMMGTDIHAFCGQVMLACLRYGLHGVLVDSPKADGVRTVAEEKAAGIRPYMAHYPCESILGFEAQRSATGLFLTQLRLKETVATPKGRFGRESVDQIRVLTPGRWEVWRQAKTTDGLKPQWVLFESGTTSIDVIPFVFFYGLREGFGIGKAPLQELAFMNVEHWQSSSDQQTILHVARVPILFAKGFAGKDGVVVGANSMASASSEKASLEYVEHSGAAIEAGRQSIKDLEDRMRQVGAELLTERQGEVTASQVNSEDEDNRSTMQKIVEEFEDSLEACIKLMALWTGDKTSAPKVTLFKDFASGNLSGKTGDLLMAAVDKGIVSRQTARDHLKRADVLAHDLDEDEETKRLAAEAAAESTTAKGNDHHVN